MTGIRMRVPKYSHKQRVRFVGGEGIVRSYKGEFGSWTYLIEMAMGPEPCFGRVGAETMVLLNEADLRAVRSKIEPVHRVSPKSSNTTIATMAQSE